MAELTKLTKHFSAGAAARKWYVVDAKGKSLGRLASRIALVLSGKHKPTYTPNSDQGDHVIVLNAEQVRLTGKKVETKIKFRHSGYPGGAVYAPVKQLLQTRPERLVSLAVRGMLPKTHLGRKMLLKLNVYRGTEHPHAAQKPEPLPARLLNL
jgi:large subunit ribosomal protein L13